MADGRAPRRQTTFGGLPQLGIRPRAPPRALASPAPSHGLATADTDIYEPALGTKSGAGGPWGLADEGGATIFIVSVLLSDRRSVVGK